MGCTRLMETRDGGRERESFRSHTFGYICSPLAACENVYLSEGVVIFDFGCNHAPGAPFRCSIFLSGRAAMHKCFLVPFHVYSRYFFSILYKSRACLACIACIEFRQSYKYSS